MTTIGLTLSALSVSALVGLAVLLLTHPRLQWGPRAKEHLGRATIFDRRFPHPLARSGGALSWTKRLLIGGGSALPLTALAAYVGLPWLVLLALVVFLAAPEAYLACLTARETARKEAQVPKAVETLCRALSAGNNLYRSLARTAEEVGPPLGNDLKAALDRFSVASDMASVLEGCRQETASRRVRGLLDVLIFDLEKGVAGTPGEVERLENLRESLAQEDAVRRELATKTAGTRFNLRLVSLVIPGTVLLVVVTDGSLLAPLLTHPLGNLSLGLSAIAYIGTLYLSHRWSRVEL